MRTYTRFTPLVQTKWNKPGRWTFAKLYCSEEVSDKYCDTQEEAEKIIKRARIKDNEIVKAIIVKEEITEEVVWKEG